MGITEDDFIFVPKMYLANQWNAMYELLFIFKREKKGIRTYFREPFFGIWVCPH